MEKQNMIEMDNKRGIQSIIKEVVVKHLNVNFKAGERANDQNFINKVLNEVYNTVMKKIKVEKKLKSFDSVAVNVIMQQADEIAYSVLKHKERVDVNPNSPKLSQFKAENFTTGKKYDNYRAYPNTSSSTFTVGLSHHFDFYK